MEYRSLQELFRRILPLEIEEEKRREELERLGLPPTYASAMALAVLKKGAQGDVTAVRFVRDTLGEKPEEEQPSNRDVRTLDLSRYTDEQLEQMVHRLREEGDIFFNEMSTNETEGSGT